MEKFGQLSYEHIDFDKASKEALQYIEKMQNVGNFNAFKNAVHEFDKLYRRILTHSTLCEIRQFFKYGRQLLFWNRITMIKICPCLTNFWTNFAVQCCIPNLKRKFVMNGEDIRLKNVNTETRDFLLK